MFVMQLVNFVTVFQVKVIDRSSIVTTDAETKVSQPSNLQELKFKLLRVSVFDI